MIATPMYRGAGKKMNCTLLNLITVSCIEMRWATLRVKRSSVSMKKLFQNYTNFGWTLIIQSSSKGLQLVIFFKPLITNLKKFSKNVPKSFLEETFTKKTQKTQCFADFTM